MSIIGESSSLKPSRRAAPAVESVVRTGCPIRQGNRNVE